MSKLTLLFIIWFLGKVSIFITWLVGRGKEWKTESGELSGGGLQMKEWKMIVLFCGIGICGVLLGIGQVLGLYNIRPF